ncbi:MAG: diaminopimelate epimerase [Pseudomonadales bacterium]|nr:diaminopimelate epimerase [Pseudomonadales bacterium]
MLLQFTKMHGLGNDFVLLDLISQNVIIRPKLIQSLADRRLGIGFDQLLLVEPPDNPDVDFKYRIFNADGTEAEQCGNGARCFLRFVRDHGLTTKTKIKLETNTGIIECQLEQDGNICVNMGNPILQPDKIPFMAENPAVLYELILNQPTTNTTQTINIASVGMGNPHAVTIVDDVTTAPVNKTGAIIEKHPRFPQRVNVGFMQILSRKKIALRVFERGVGETSACGTGACAAVVAGRLQGLLDATVEVNLQGGKLKITWQGDASPVMMTGSANRVFEGQLQI